MLPSLLAANALAVQSAYREYQQRALARDGLRKMYIGTLTLTLILAVFGALAAGGDAGAPAGRPLLLLAQGMRQVAKGDLSAKPVLGSRDELGGLTRSFAEMTEQLSDARELVERSVAQVESARTNLQTILDNLTAGVIVFDRDGKIDTVNPGATRILRLPLLSYRGRRLDDVPGLPDFARAVAQRFELHASSPEAGERDQWQDSFELQTQNLDGRERDGQTLLVRGAAMPHGARLLVFDDITEVVSAQRSEAWSEVARRLAHEIKNPLTPIQLSAERLQHKLEGKLEGTDQAMLVRSVGTIVNQVQAMKRLVNEFRDYARLPAVRLAPVDLNALAAEVLALYANEQEAGLLRIRAARRAAADRRRQYPAAAGDPQPGAERARRGRRSARPQVRLRTELARNETGRGASGAAGGDRQWRRLSRQGAQARLRALRDDQEQGHRPGPGGGQEDRRRARRAGAHRQPGAGPARPTTRRPHRRLGWRGARRASFYIIFQIGAQSRALLPRTAIAGTGALRVHGHHSCS